MTVGSITWDTDRSGGGEEEGSALRMCRVGMQDGAPFLPNSTLQCARRPGASHRY
jgi:hypothetical protein